MGRSSLYVGADDRRLGGDGLIPRHPLARHGQAANADASADSVTYNSSAETNIISCDPYSKPIAASCERKSFRQTTPLPLWRTRGSWEGRLPALFGRRSETNGRKRQPTESQYHGNGAHMRAAPRKQIVR